jgi:alpha-L-rhamnosidase
MPSIKRQLLKSISLYLLFMGTTHSMAQKINPDLLQKQWTASWITVPEASPNGYGVYLFRKTIDMPAKPASFVVHISADNRYKLFVNEKLVSLGPARGDLNHWNFETVDLAPYLKSGKNTLAAQVWNEGEWRPEAQISHRTGFILQGNTSSESVANTNDTWKGVRDNSYAPLKFTVPEYYVSGPGEIRQLAIHPRQWEKTDFDDSRWPAARKLFAGTPKTMLGPYGVPNGWMLVPSSIPQMEMKDERLQKVVETAGGVSVPAGFPQSQAVLTIPANTSVRLLLDQTYLTNAYPTVIFSGGKDAAIVLKYAEALYGPNRSKGNRNETQGKVMEGRTDSLISEGSARQQFVPLAYRTYRYIQLNITTRSEPLTLNDIYGTFTGYPFEWKAKLSTQNSEIDKIAEIGWRTARLCATETYMDCPYYEQLQYIGDARIQALVTLYNSGDERMVRNALDLMDNSRQPEGVTLSRHPSYSPQYIPTFSLWYIGMLHDYARYGSDLDFVKKKIGGTRQILDYFHGYQQADGSLKNVPQWMFTDWVTAKDWRAGIAPMSAEGTSAVLDLQLLWAYQVAADLENKLGLPAMAAQYQTRIDQLKKTIMAKYWDPSRKLLADRKEKDVFSQHANALAILTGLFTPPQSAEAAKLLLSDNTLAPASIYFKYYLHQALTKAGLGNDYLAWLDKWRENIAMGLTTWAETSDIDKTRSDCHAWGASPNIEFYRTLLGIDSDAFGFSKVKIEPHLGAITSISGTMPHPRGEIAVSYQSENGQWKARIDLPKSVTGKLVWKGKTIALEEGTNDLKL